MGTLTLSYPLHRLSRASLGGNLQQDWKTTEQRKLERKTLPSSESNNKMDVTSLLNSGTEAALQQQRRNSSTPPRSRTPWDANGYSLPLNTITCPTYSASTTSASPQPTPVACASIQPDSLFDSQKRNGTSFRHKSFSSRSSLSSTTSSLLSTTHSRLSSLSTVNSCYPGQSIFAVNSLSFMSENLPEGMNFASLDATNDQSTALSPTSTLGALALVAEQHLSADRAESTDPSPATLDITTLEDTNTSIALQEGLSQERPRSPSDAILIKRIIATPVLQSNIRESYLNSEREPGRNFSTTSLQKHNKPTFIRSHKRCVSAPDISATMNNFPTRQPTDMRPRAEPSPPSSQPPESSSPTNSTYPAPDTPPNITEDAEANPVVCMYIENCDTGSQPRKAISHIFGRNKMCTRLIPSHVWVHYCRKHYQRSRYRNPKEYAKLQCDLVQQQIRRVHQWSLKNKRMGAGGVVQDWGLSVRKREKKRLDDLGGTNRKRRAAILDQNDDDETENFDNLPGMTGSPIPATAVPDWLLTLCGKGYTTAEILGIFNQLHTEILSDRMACFPDIEILPNIALDPDDSGSLRGGTKRRARVTGHRRSQSLGVATKSESDSPDRRLSESSTGASEIPTDSWSGPKRRRPDEQGNDEAERFLPQTSRTRMRDPPPDTGRRIHHLVHRPVFANITENQADDDNHIEGQQGDTYPCSSAPYQSSFQSTDHQRSSGLSNGAMQPVRSSHYGPRRHHSRSQSDVTAFSQGGISTSQRMLFNNVTDDQTLSSQQPGQGHPNNYTFLPPQNSTANMMTQQSPGTGHTRHQSTPGAYLQTNEPVQSIGAHVNIPHQRTGSNTLHHPRQVYETQVTRDLYSARR